MMLNATTTGDKKMKNYPKDTTQDLAQGEVYARLTSRPFDLSTYVKPIPNVPGSGDLYMTARSLVTLVTQLHNLVNELGGDEGTLPLRLTANGGEYTIPVDADRDTISRIVARIREEV